MPLVIEQCCACSRIAGAPTTTSRKQRHSCFFSHREGDVTSHRAALRRRRWRGITCRKRDALRPTREATRATLRRASVLLFLALTTVLLWVPHIWPPRILIPVPRGFSTTLGYISVDRTEIMLNNLRIFIRIIYEYL